MDDYEVGKTTLFEFDLVLSSATIQSGDYLEIKLPDDYDIEFSTSGTPSCSVDNISVSACLIQSSKKANIVFSSDSSQTFISGSISKFKNPVSNRS